MKILIIGSSGYVAQNLIPKLEEHEIITFDEQKRGSQDIRMKDAVAKNIRYHLPDVIINFAAIMGVQHVDKNLKLASDVNIMGTLNVMMIVQYIRLQLYNNEIKEIKAFSHPPNMDKIWNPHIILISNLAAAKPTNAYSIHKYLVEQIAELNIKYGDLKITILRFSNLYGGIGYLKKPSVISKFIDARKKGERAKIYGSGSAVRDFVHVNDVCEGILCTIKNASFLPFDVKIYEICSGVGSSIIDLAKIIVGDKFDVEATSDGGVDSNIGNWKRAEEEIGYRPRIPLKQGLDRLLEESLREEHNTAEY